MYSTIKTKLIMVGRTFNSNLVYGYQLNFQNEVMNKILHWKKILI